MKFVNELDSCRNLEIWELSKQYSLEIYTAKEAKPNAECEWFYQIVCDDYFGEFFFEDVDFGFINLCSCSECEKFGVDLFEYFSIYEALSWVKYYVPRTTVHLWVTSKRFRSEAWNGKLRYKPKNHTCNFIRNLCNGLQNLVSELDVRIAHPNFSALASIKKHRKEISDKK